jgi:O-antigen ligase
MIALLKNFAPLILYVGFVAVFFACIAGRVQLGLMFLIPLIPLQNVIEKMHPYPMGDNLNDILFLGMLIGWLVSKAGGGKEPFMIKSPFNILLFLFLLYTYFSLVLGSFYIGDPFPINPAHPRVQNWKNYMLLPLIFFLTANNVKSVKDIRLMIIAMCACMLLMNYYNVQQVKDMTSWTSRAKVTGTFVWLGANETAAFYATYTFVLIGLFLTMKKSGLIRPILFWYIVVHFFIVLFFYSRAAYLAALVGLFFIALVRFRILILPLLMLVLAWQTLLPQEVLERINFSEEAGQLDQSAQTRIILWEQSIEFFKQNPVFGVGYNIFAKIGLKKDTHNIFLKTLAEQGIIGEIFLLFIMGLAFSRSWKLYKNTEDPLLKGLGLGFSACILAVAVGNLFGDRWTHLPLGAFFWAFLGMVERGNFICGQENPSLTASPENSSNKPSAKKSRGRYIDVKKGFEKREG